jgi:hypothetical protein
MPKPQPPHVSLRVNVSLEMFEKVSAYRHQARHDAMGQALVALLAAGLAALSVPASVPIRPFEPQPEPDLSGMHEHKPGDGKRYSGLKGADQPKTPRLTRAGLVAYAGANGHDL